jgi:hypothetical protein
VIKGGVMEKHNYRVKVEFTCNAYSLDSKEVKREPNFENRLVTTTSPQKAAKMAEKRIMKSDKWGDPKIYQTTVYVDKFWVRLTRWY